MSHRRRYAVTTTRETVVDLLALDAMNPRSVLYHLTEIREHVGFLPNAEVNGQLSHLSRALLQEATFQGPIDLTGAFMFLTRIEGIDLTKATGLQQTQADQACGDANTKLPDGLKVPATWPCKFQFD